MKTKKRIQTRFLGWLLRIVAMVALAAGTIPQYAPQASVNAAPAAVLEVGSVNVAPASPTLTAVDPLAWGMFGDVLPVRPFLYSVDSNGITITRFNDNQVVGTWSWPTSLWIELPDGSITEIFEPVGGWGEPVGMAVSYPTETEIANRVKEIPDLTPPWTFVYVVMPHSGYEWQSNPNPGLLQSPNVRDNLVESTSPANESALLIQIDVSDPSFSTWNDPVAPTPPHIAGAILGHGAGQPVYDRSTGNVYVGNLPSMSLPTTPDAAVDLTSFVSVIHRIPPEVTAEEAEIPGISKPVIRCGPQHPETGIPVGRPQAYACYDPSGYHPIDDNEHVGAFGEFEWEFRNWPDPAVGPLGTWLTPHIDLVTGELDGILYGTPPATGEWYIEARVHNLDDPYGVWSDWHPIQLLVTPDAEYLPIKAQFAPGVPVAYQLEGTGACTLSGAPAWIDVQPVPNGCVVMGRAPISGEYYNFTMPDFKETGYPDIPIVFSGNVVGAYNFDPLPAGAGISGLAWHQVEKYQDPSTEPPVMTLEFIGVDPVTGQLYQILQPPGQPQPPNERPAETTIGINTVSKEGAPLGSTFGPFGEVAVEADRDIFVAAADGVIKVSGGNVSTIALGFQPSSLSLDSDLRTAIPGVEPGQVDHGALWATGTDTAALIDTDLGTVPYTFPVPGASSVSADFDTQYAYVANASPDIAIFGPAPRPPLEPRIWSSEEITWNVDKASIADGPFTVMTTGDLPTTLSLLGDLPEGITFVDNLDGTATISGIPSSSSPDGGCGGTEGEGDPEGGDVCGGFAFALTATNAYGTYAQALGMDVNTPPMIDSPNTATFYAGSASSFTVFGTGIPEPIFYTWDETTLAAAGVQLIDNENGTASLVGTPTTPGTYTFLLEATTGWLPDATQPFTLTVATGSSAPEITSFDTASWEVIGAPFAPDPFAVTSIGSPTPELSVVTAEGQTGLPPGVTFIDNGDSTATFGGDCQITWPGMDPSCLGLLPDGAEGTWTFTIRASNSEGTTDQTFTLDVETATSIMTPGPDAPANLAFAYTPGGPMPPAQTFSVRTLGDTMPYAAVTTADWLHATPESGWVGPDEGDISVSIDPTGLAPGTYTGTILVASAGTEGPFATALVTLTVVDPLPAGTLGIFPGALSFEYNVNDGILPPPQSVLVLSGGVPLDYTVSAGDARWLSASDSGTAPGVVSVSVDPRVGVGMHIGNLTIASNDKDYGPQTQNIPVTLVKTAGNSDLIQVMFDVGSGPEGLAANLDTHNLFITSSNAAAEAAEAGEAVIPAVELPGSPEPPLVFHINPVDQTLLGEIVVHGEAEYIGANSTTGIAYQASQATGEIAVIDGSTNSVLTYIDLTLNGDPQSPYQVAIDEAQNIIYVGAKSPEPEPYALIPDANGKYGCKAIRELPSDEVPEGGEPELDCWHPGPVIVIDGNTNQVVSHFMAGDDPEGVVFAAATGKVYASNEDDGTVTVAQGAVRNGDGSITPPVVLGTIIDGELVPGQWEPTCDANNYCGERENLKAWLWPELSACHGIDDEAEEADKMSVDPDGNVYIIDDRYRVAKIDAATDAVDEVIEIPGFDCEATVPDDSSVVFHNTANNIAYMALGQGKLYVTSEQNTLTLIEWSKKGKKTITTLTTLTIPGAAELDAITTDPALNRVYITDEELASLWILKGACANGTGIHCLPGGKVGPANVVGPLPVYLPLTIR
jgi:DNA-binding beta-propeller fold protein YncE